MRLNFFLVANLIWVLLLGMVFYYLLPKNPVVLFNQEALQGQFIRQLAEHKASKIQVERATHQFNKSLKQVLTAYAQKHRAVILESKNILAGGIDVTPQITKELSRSMRKKS